MQTHILNGFNNNYIYFPENPETILSSGKFSIVYLGLNSNKEKVIIKQLNPNIEKNEIATLRFILEANIHIDHPSVVRTIDVINQGNSKFFVQEFIEGISLRELIRNNTLTKNHSLISKISINLLKSLQAVHEHNIIHRDIKPSNIIIGYKKSDDPEEKSINWENPEVHIIDFGLFKSDEMIPLFVDESKRNPFSLLYSAPEVLLNKEKLIDQRSDIYNVGLLMMEMFTGQPVFYSENPAKLIDMQLNDKISQPSDMYNRFFEIIKKASSKKALPASPKNIPSLHLLELLDEGINLRYPSAKEMQNEIETFLKKPGEKPEKGIKFLKKFFKKA